MLANYFLADEDILTLLLLLPSMACVDCIYFSFFSLCEVQLTDCYILLADFKLFKSKSVFFTKRYLLNNPFDVVICW